MCISSELVEFIKRFQGELVSIKVSKKTYDRMFFEFDRLSLHPDKQSAPLSGMQINGVEINHD